MLFWAHLTVLRLITTIMRKNFTNLISPAFQCTSITNRVLRSFNRFPASYNCMSEKFKNLISPGVKCTSVTNRVLSSFDRFTAYYNCMRKNFKNLISPLVQWSITKSCSQIIWPSHGLFQLYEIKLKKSHNFVSSVHKYHKSFSQLPWPIFGFLQLYEEKLQKSHISVSSVHKYQKSCS